MDVKSQTDNDVVEIARLTNKIPLLIRILGGVFPGLPCEQLAGIKDVLDVGCGPGVWLLECARAYEGTHIVGIDTRSAMITYITNQLNERQLTRVQAHFVSSLTDPLPFDDASFDVVNLQWMSLLLPMQQWLAVLKEGKRVLRPGGFLRMSEFELGYANAPAHERWHTLCWDAMKQKYQAPSPSHRHLGWLGELEPLLAAAGFRESWCVPHMINYSYGAPFHLEWARDLRLLIKRSLPHLVADHLLTQEEAELLEQQLLQDLDLPTFHAFQPLLTVWGKKC